MPGARLSNHWRWRPDWSPDRACLWWYLTFEDQPGLAHATRRTTSALTRVAAVDVIPQRWLHLTLLEIGYADALDIAAVATVVGSAHLATATLSSFQLELTAIKDMDSAVVLQASPTEAIDELRSRLPGRLPDYTVDGAKPADADSAIPHVSLAYVNEDCDTTSVMNSLPKSIEPLDVKVSKVTLAAVTRRDFHYQWSTVAQIALPTAR